MTEASSAEININPRRQDQMTTRALIRQKCHHQVLQKTAGFGQSHIHALSSVAGLLEENRVAADLAHVNGDLEALTGENTIHDGDILVRGIAGSTDGNDENTALEPLVFICGGVSACSGRGPAATTSSFRGGVFEVGAAVLFGPGDCAPVDVA